MQPYAGIVIVALFSVSPYDEPCEVGPIDHVLGVNLTLLVPRILPLIPLFCGILLSLSSIWCVSLHLLPLVAVRCLSDDHRARHQLIFKSIASLSRWCLGTSLISIQVRHHLPNVQLGMRLVSPKR